MDVSRWFIPKFRSDNQEGSILQEKLEQKLKNNRGGNLTKKPSKLKLNR